MTFAEFQTWAEQYPTVLDCVYYRLMDTAEDMRQQQRMRELQELLEGAQSATRDADARHRAAVASLEEFRDVVNAAERRLGDAGEAEMSAKRRLDEYRERTAAQRQRVRDQQLALSRSRDEERQWHYRMQAAQSDTKGALSVLRQAEAKLHELQVELERHSAGVNAAKEAVSAAYDREAQLAQEADAAVRKIQDIERSFGSLEDDVQHAAVTEQGALDDYRRTAHDVLIAHEALEKATVQLKGSADVVFAAAAAVDGAAAHEKDVGSQLGALQHGIANFTAHRLTTNEEECHLMAEEVALRRQRQALETREAHLRSTHQRSYKATTPVLARHLAGALLILPLTSDTVHQPNGASLEGNAAESLSSVLSASDPPTMMMGDSTVDAVDAEDTMTSGAVDTGDAVAVADVGAAPSAPPAPVEVEDVLASKEMSAAAHKQWSDDHDSGEPFCATSYTGPPPPSVVDVPELRPDLEFISDLEDQKSRLQEEEDAAVLDETVNAARGARWSVWSSQVRRAAKKSLHKVNTTLETGVRDREKSHNRTRYSIQFLDLAGREALVAYYKCDVLNRGRSVGAEIFVTEGSLAICLLDNDVRVIVSWKDIVCIQKAIALNTYQSRTPHVIPLPDDCIQFNCVELYTAQERVIQLLNFGTITTKIAEKISGHCKGETVDRALSYIHHTWAQAR
ncbi:hypothetical protein DIPPA_12225 [Diplonema papillatum]|nr:hypothetical protein DIPPA_12225 [Diplonema papillatum]